MTSLPIASRCRDIDASGIRKVFELAEQRRRDGVELVDLSIGQPDFPVPDVIKQAAVEAIWADFNAYTVTQGIQPLRDKVAGMVRERIGVDPEAVMITSGVSGGLLLALLATVGPGDEVIIVDPFFVMYKHLVTLAGGKSVILSSYDDFSLPLDRIADAINDRTKVILLNSPCNPTGCVYGEGELRQLAELAEKHNLLVVSDEIYRCLWYDQPPASIVKMIPHRSILLDGFSKSLALTGWRVGYATGPRQILEQMTKLQQYTFVCAPSFAQKATMAMDQFDLEPIRQQYARRRDLVYEGLKDHFEVVRPGGGFYIFPKAPIQPAAKFVEMALERNVLVIPGKVFSEHDTHFRISYARREEELARGVEILRDLAGRIGR